MRPALAFCALLLLAVPSQPEAQQRPAPTAPANPAPRFWYSASSADGGYTVDMPGKVVERRLEIKSAGRPPVVSHLQEVNLDGGKTYFGMVWTRVVVPKSDAEIEKTLMRMRDQTTAAMKGSLITTRAAKYGSFQGLEYVIEAGPEATRSRYRVYFVGDRIVQQVYSGTTGSENSPDVRKFHESLKLKQ
jgi:hypothetical protein